MQCAQGPNSEGAQEIAKKCKEMEERDQQNKVQCCLVQLLSRNRGQSVSPWPSFTGCNERG